MQFERYVKLPEGTILRRREVQTELAGWVRVEVEGQHASHEFAQK